MEKDGKWTHFAWILIAWMAVVAMGWAVVQLTGCVEDGPVTGRIDPVCVEIVDVAGSGYGEFGRDPFVVAAGCGDVLVDGRAVGSLEAVSDVDAAGESLVVLADGELWLWGNDPVGSAGGGASDGGLRRARDGCWSLVVRDKQAATGCAVACDGSLSCWGQNLLGKVDPDQGGGVHDVVEAAYEGCWRDVSVGLAVTCAQTCDGRAWCWGTQGADDFPGGDVKTAWRGRRRVPELDGADEINLGMWGHCARWGADVECWGSERQGQLGRGTCEGRSAFLERVDLPPVRSLGGPGSSHGATLCAALEDGGEACWGDDDGACGGVPRVTP